MRKSPESISNNIKALAIYTGNPLKVIPPHILHAIMDCWLDWQSIPLYHEFPFRQSVIKARQN